MVHLDTFGAVIPDEPKIPASMRIDDATFPFEGPVGVELRGNSSQAVPKKQYAITLRDQNGGDVDASLLGLPAEEDWILFAPYSDRSALRNVFAYTLAREIGWYASRHAWCELTVNGVYQGLYILLEKIKRDKHRLDIAKLDERDNAGDSVTGGYILKFDKVDDDEEGFVGAADSLGDFL